MKKKAIAYFNKELKFYESLKLVENQSDEDIIGSCKRFVGLVPIKDAPIYMGKSIHIVGEFNDEVASPLVPYKEPVLVVDCDEILNSRFPTLYENDGNSNN